MEEDYRCCELPEGCLAHMVSLTCPRDACRLAVVSTIFKAAAESDAVWDCFLTADLQSIFSRSSVAVKDLPVQSKKELFMFLARNPILIDGGKMSFRLDKWSGKKCYMLSTANLAIVWGDTPRYWKWFSDPKSRFNKVAVLQNVCWLEITGKIRTNMLSPSTCYSAFFVFKATTGLYGFCQPVDTKVGLIGSGNYRKRKVCLDVDRDRSQTVRRRRLSVFAARIPTGNCTVECDEFPNERMDGWFEIELGDFYYAGDGSDNDGELEVRLFEIEGGHWKGGIVVQGIEIRPKGDKSSSSSIMT